MSMAVQLFDRNVQDDGSQDVTIDANGNVVDANGTPMVTPSIAGGAVAPTGTVSADTAGGKGPTSLTALGGSTYTASVPTLPDPEGKQAPVQQVAALMNNTQMYSASPGAPLSQAEMFNILQRSASEGYVLSSVLNRAANMAVIAGKKAEASDLEKQIQGERIHAAVAFGTAVLSAVATIGVGVSGSAMKKAETSDVAQAESKAASKVTPPEPTQTVLKDKGRANDVAREKVKATDDSANVAGSSDAKASDVNTEKSANEKLIAKQKDEASNAANPLGNSAASIKNRKPEGLVTRNNAPVNAKVEPPSQISSTGDTALQAKTSIKGTFLKAGRNAWGDGLAQSGQAVGGIISSTGDLTDKLAGGNYQADQAKIAQKQDALGSQIAQVTLDSSKSSQDQALEALKAAQQLVQSFSQRWTEVNNNISNR